MSRCTLLALLLTVSAVCQSQTSTGEQARGILDKALKDKNPDTRKQAAIALSLSGPQQPFLTLLESMLDDKDVEVRLAAVASLADLKNNRTVAALSKGLKDEVPEVSFAAAKALWALNDPAGKETLLSVLSGEVKASSSWFTKEKRDAMRVMHTPKAMFMLALKQGIGFAPVPGLGQGIASMQALLSDPGVSGRAAAALLLGRDKDPQTVQAFREALSDRDWSVRAAAVHSLALRNDPALEPDLQPLLEDKKEEVRLRAAAGYLRLEMINAKLKPVRKR